MKVNLHAHCSQGSYDALLSARKMIDQYADAGFGAVAITDHDQRTSVPDDDRLITLEGIEHTVDAERHTHIVEIPDHDFRILAHPAFSHPEDPKAAIRELAREYDLDAVEKWNCGARQYRGDLDAPLIEVAGDDAHNPLQVGHTYMEVPDSVSSAGGVISAIRSGRHELVRDPKPVRSLLGHATKGVSFAALQLQHSLGLAGSPPSRTTIAYDRHRRR